MSKYIIDELFIHGRLQILMPYLLTALNSSYGTGTEILGYSAGCSTPWNSEHFRDVLRLENLYSRHSDSMEKRTLP